MCYLDITDKYTIRKSYQIKKQKYFIDDNGIKYDVEGKYVVLEPTKREMDVAKIIGAVLGGQINIVPKVNEPPKIKTPDYIINEEAFDLKGIKGKGKNTLDNAIRKQEKQASNFIFDISKTEMKINNIVEQVKNIYSSEHRKWVKRIILIKDEEVIKIYKRI